MTKVPKWCATQMDRKKKDYIKTIVCETVKTLIEYGYLKKDETMVVNKTNLCYPPEKIKDI